MVTGNTPLMPTPVARDYKGVPGDGVQMASLPREISLLPTPSVADADGGHKNRSSDRSDEPLLGGIASLLPTPMTINRTSRKAQTGRPTSGPQRGGPSYGLEDVIGLLPTPNTMDSLPPKTREQIQAHRSAGKGGDRNLREAVLYELEGTWGRFAPAIARWEEILGRSAPPPTEEGKNGPRLNPRLSEWMMGLPEGWVTDVPGLTRQQQLHLTGNGVVPQQAALALRVLLARMNSPL